MQKPTLIHYRVQFVMKIYHYRMIESILSYIMNCDERNSLDFENDCIAEKRQLNKVNMEYNYIYLQSIAATTIYYPADI